VLDKGQRERSAKPFPADSSAASRKARVLYRTALVWDMTLPGIFAGLNEIRTLHRYRSAGIGFVSITIGNDTLHDPETVGRRIAEIRHELHAGANVFQVVQSASDILSARQEAKLAISFHLQGTNALGNDIASVEKFRQLGITHMLLAYNSRNAVADGCAERADAGLSLFGIAVVREMNRVGMLVDGSHTGYRSSMDAIEASRKPVIFSHANAYAIFPHYRNIRDDQIKACARTGGVIGVNGVGAFLSETGEASAETIGRHVDHMVDLVGAEHVGFGLDFITHVGKFAAMAEGAGDQWPSHDGERPQFDQFAAPEIIESVAERLCLQGYADRDIIAILGGNFLRAFRAVVG
jgi:membrane dipeptidase